MPEKLLSINKFQVLIAIVFFLAMCVYFIPAPNHAIRVHDTFDGNFTSRHVLNESGYLFNLNPSAIVPGIMNGLPRGVFNPVTEMVGLLMYFFGPLNGFAIAFLLVRLIGIAGLYLFGRDHLNIKENQKGFLWLLAIAFGCLPVFVIQSFTVTGIPLMLWAFYNIIKQQKQTVSLTIIVLLGIWSQLVLVGFHIIFITGIMAVLYSVSRHKIQWRLFGSIFLLGFVYIITNYMLFYLHGVDTSYQSARGEFEKELGLNMKGVIGGTVTTIFTGDYSAACYFGYLFIPLLAYYPYALYKERLEKRNIIGITALMVVILASFLINLLDWKGMAGFYKTFAFANNFNLKRFTNVLPAFFFILILAAGIKLIEQFKTAGQLIVTVLTAVFLVFLWRGNISHNYSGFNTIGLKIEKEDVNTFNSFFEPAVYKQVKAEMGSDSTNNIIHFGMSPSPSKYAGLNVLDDYQGDYPKSYKTEFRKIIAGELDKSEDLKNYFDNWGSRCYMESANHFGNTLETLSGLAYEPNLAINTVQLKTMNCKYILSAILIGNSQPLGLHLKKVLVGSYTHKVYFLYKII